mgnify:CR=1 FL=1
MTKAAKLFGKDQRKFFLSQETQEYLDELRSIVPETEQLVDATRGRYGGTWAQPKLAVFFARWLDTRFAVACEESMKRSRRTSLLLTSATLLPPAQTSSKSLTSQNQCPPPQGR